MDVKHEAHKGKGIFYIEDNGERIATLTYYFENEKKFIIEHTVVDVAYEGKGLGKALVNAAAIFAKENNFKIVPVCLYAKKVMERSDAYKDVLY